VKRLPEEAPTPGCSSLVDRRSFLKVSAAATLLAGADLRAARVESPAKLSAIPEPADLKGDRIVHTMRDLFQQPTTQNEWGYAQAAKSVAGITAISFPPFACCGIPEMPWSPGFLLTCELFLNGRLLASFPAPGDQVTYTWFPHRTLRECRVEGLHFATETFMPSEKRAVAERIVVRNESASSRTFSLGFDMRAAVAKKMTAWFTNSPGEADNETQWDRMRGCVVFEARRSKAASVQGVQPAAARCEFGRTLVYDVKLDPGQERVFHYVNAIGESAKDCLAEYDLLQATFDAVDKGNEETFRRLMRSAFTPGNSDFSGHLPVLETKDELLWKLYQAGFSNLLFARRASPDSAYGTSYITLGGKVLPTLSFPWDTSVTSLGLALLDPLALRGMVETWMSRNMHEHLATDYVTGEAVGPWYAVNDMAIVRCAENYLRVSGDFAWLQTKLEGKSVLERLVDHSVYWKTLDKRARGLGDYGKIENLLEVVSTYLHETAGMNAGNISSMRFVAHLLDSQGDATRAAQLRDDAQGLARRINETLYVPGKGWWKCGQPDGSFNEVRHCYDFLSVLDNMSGDVSEAQKREMTQFFWRELYTPLWMRALSPSDSDATWNIRPDHSWLGAYAAWPPMTAKGLYKTEDSSRVARWLKGVAKAANQGPIGQAHFVEDFFPPERGGAFKSPNDAPYINDWCCIAGGCFLDMVIDSVFGAELTLSDGLLVHSRVADFDPSARLRNLRYQGKRFDVSRNGAHPST
jgi:hypothetical protein